MRLTKHLIAGLALLLIAACRDFTAPPDPPNSLQSGSPTSIHEPDIPAPLDRYQIDVVVSGAFKPGRPLQVRATAMGLLGTKEVEFTLVMPEVEGARRGGWTKLKMPVGERMAVAEYTGGLAVGQVAELRTTVTIPVAGYFRAIARVAQQSTESALEKGAYYRPIDYREL